MSIMKGFAINTHEVIGENVTRAYLIHSDIEFLLAL